jgi:hypothetical protein
MTKTSEILMTHAEECTTCLKAANIIVSSFSGAKRRKNFQRGNTNKNIFLKNFGGLCPEAPLKYATAKHAWRNQYVSADLSILFVFY